MKNNIFYSLGLGAIALIFNACGTNSKADGGSVGANGSDIRASISCYYMIDAESGPEKFVYHCYVHTVDSNSDPVNDLTYTISVITNIKASNNNGTILTTDPITFSDDRQTFVQSGIQSDDTLIIVPSEGKTDPSYLGNWQISSVNSNTNLSLKERAFNLETTEGLSYYIGNETRYDLGGAANAHIEYSADNNTTLSTISDEGKFYFRVHFDHRLADTGIILGAYSGENRIGTASFHTLIVEEPEEVEEETTE